KKRLHHLTTTDPFGIDKGQQQYYTHRQHLYPRNHKCSILVYGWSIIERREDISRKLTKGNRNCRNSSRLYDRKQTPTVQETRHLAKNLSHISILTTRFGIHGRKFPVTDRCSYGSYSSDDPNRKHPIARTQLPHHVRRDNKDTTTDHRAHHDHRRIP